MKIYAIKDGLDKKNRELAYLFYYEKEEKFYIEIPDQIDSTKLPIVLALFYERGYRTINSYYSKQWVMDRIIPPDRQNIAQILKNAGLDHYDEFQLLIKSKGRCSQDSCYIEEIHEDQLPKFFKERNGHKVVEVTPLDNHKILVFFRSGTARKVNVKDLVGKKREFYRVLNEEKIFNRVNVSVGGQGIEWSLDLVISCEELYHSGVEVPLSLNDIKCFINKSVIDTKQASELLECSKQNINDLVKKGRLIPIKENQKYKLFLESEVLERIWK